MRLESNYSQSRSMQQAQRVVTAREFNQIPVHAIMKFLNFSKCVHGFAVSGDLSIPGVKFGKEQAFANAVQWFKAALWTRSCNRDHMYIKLLEIRKAHVSGNSRVLASSHDEAPIYQIHALRHVDFRVFFFDGWEPP